MPMFGLQHLCRRLLDGGKSNLRRSSSASSSLSFIVGWIGGGNKSLAQRNKERE